MRSITLVLFVMTFLSLGGCASTPDNKNLSEGERLDRIHSLLITAKEETSANNLGVAVLRYEQVLELDSDNIEALVGAGDVAYRMSDYESANGYYEKVLAIDPENVDAAEGQALSNLKLEQYQTAREQLHAVVLKDDTRWRSYNALGILSDMDGKYEQAQIYYRKALAPNESNVKVLNNLGYSYIMNKQYKEAESVLEKAFTLESSDFRVRNNYAISVAWQERYQEAIEVLAKAVPYEVAYNNVGYIAFLRGDLNSARFYLKKALNTSPSYYAEAAANLEKVEKALERMKGKRSLP